GVAGDLRLEGLEGAQLGGGAQPLAEGACGVDAQQGAAQVVVEGEWHVGGGVDSAGDADVDLSEGDLVGDEDHRFEPGAAGLLDVVRRGAWVEPGAEHHLSGEVEVARVLEYRAGDDLADSFAG